LNFCLDTTNVFISIIDRGKVSSAKNINGTSALLPGNGWGEGKCMMFSWGHSLK